MTPDLPGLVQQIAHFESRLQADPTSRVFVPLADLYRRTGRLSEGRRILERGLHEHPRFITAWAALGLLLTEMGESGEARRALQTVIQADPENTLALRLLGRDAADRGDWELARDLGERLLRLEPEDSTVREALREARRRLDATSMANKVPAAEPDPMPAIISPKPAAKADQASTSPVMGFETATLAELYLRQGHSGKARTILQRILANNPDHPEALAVLARTESGESKPEAEPEVAPRAAAENASLISQDENVPSQVMGGGDDLDRFRAWLDASDGSNQSRG